MIVPSKITWVVIKHASGLTMINQGKQSVRTRIVVMALILLPSWDKTVHRHAFGTIKVDAPSFKRDLSSQTSALLVLHQQLASMAVENMKTTTEITNNANGYMSQINQVLKSFVKIRIAERMNIPLLIWGLSVHGVVKSIMGAVS
jgi:hypothetical protein